MELYPPQQNVPEQIHYNLFHFEFYVIDFFKPETGVLRGTPEMTVGSDGSFWGTSKYPRF